MIIAIVYLSPDLPQSAQKVSGSAYRRYSMSENQEMDPKKELARLKRMAMEIASEMHDIVEDTFMDRVEDLLPLSQKAIAAVQEYRDFKSRHSL